AHHNPAHGWRDLRSLFDAQWPDGRVPHIVFDPGVDERDYFPGPAFWTVAPWPCRSRRPTSGVTQPPVHALAAWRLYHPPCARTRATSPLGSGGPRAWSRRRTTLPGPGISAVRAWRASSTRGSRVWTTAPPGTRCSRRSRSTRPNCAGTTGGTFRWRPRHIA